MRKFTVLLRKELKELLTLQMLLPFVIIVIMFASIGSLVSGQGEEAQAKRQVGVIDLDGSELSAALLDSIETAGFEVVAVDETDSDGLIDTLEAEDIGLGILIPPGFGQGVGTGVQQRVDTYSVIEGFSVMAAEGSGVLGAVLEAANDGLSTELIAEAAVGSDPIALKQPVDFMEHVILGEAQAQAGANAVYGFVMQQTTFIPVILFVVIIFAAQMIATTIASEKENKTLETLLSSPVSRGSLISAKMLAAATVALLSAVAYMFGLRSYMTGMTEGLGGGTSEAMSSLADSLGLSLTTGDWALLGCSLFVSILVALSIAVILGAFAENVKAVQSLLTPLMVMVMIPYFLTMFVDIEAAGPVVKWVVLAIPFTHAFSAAPNLFLNNHTAVLMGIGYQLLWVAALITVAAKIFSSDRILTMKLNLRRKKS